VIVKTTGADGKDSSTTLTYKEDGKPYSTRLMWRSVVKNAALRCNWLNGCDVSMTRNRLCTGLCTDIGDGEMQPESGTEDRANAPRTAFLARRVDSLCDTD
jgi:hypothetical protein